MKKIISIIIIMCLYNLPTMADNHYFKNIRSDAVILIKDEHNNKTLVSFGLNKFKFRNGGENFYIVNDSTINELYLNNLNGENILHSKKIYLKKHRAYAHILSDKYGIVSISITLRHQPGFVHMLDLNDFDLDNGAKQAKFVFAQLQSQSDNDNISKVENNISQKAIDLVGQTNINEVLEAGGTIGDNGEVTLANGIEITPAGDDVNAGFTFNF